MSPDLFPIPTSKPPLLDSLRKAYDEAHEALALAEGEALALAEGEAKRMGIGYNGVLSHAAEAAEAALLAEEARLVSGK